MENIEPREARAEALSGSGVRAGRWRALAAALTGAQAAYFAAGALCIGAIFWWLQFSTRAVCCGDFDGYYHIRWSRLLWEGMRAGNFPPQFTWLPLTTLNPRDYVDHHLLFHVLQIPFTWFGDLRPGAKVSAWLFATSAVLACYWLTLRHRLRYPLVWLFALLGCSAPFLFRMNMTKAMSVSIVLLVVGINLLFRRRYAWLLPLAFVFTLTYDMFVLLGLAALIWAAIILWSERRFEWRPLVWVGVGVAAGTVINPYFPHNVRLLYEHAVMKFAVADQDRPRVGNEWYPYESWDFLGNCAVAFAAMVAGYIAFQWRELKESQRALFFLVLSTVLLVANAKWRRFAEYWPPFAILFAAFSLHPWLARAGDAFAGEAGGGAEGAGESQPRARGAGARDAARRRAEWHLITASFAGLLLFVAMLYTVRVERREIADSDPPEDYYGGIMWLRANVPAGEIVFNTDWDDFPKLFYYDPTHAYVSGLDPTYLYDRDRELSKLYDRITLGHEKDPGPLIRDRFKARYVFTDNEEVHDPFYDAAMNSGWFDEVYTDDTCTVLRVREQKGEPPPEAGDEGEAGDGQQDDGGEQPDEPGEGETDEAVRQ